MVERNLILDMSHPPSYEEITNFISEPSRALWEEINLFIRNNYKASPKITYSKCPGQPGWNVKYQKSGKSICTLYPEDVSFIVLVVVTLELLPIIKAMSNEFEPYISEVIKSAKPFNGTLWLMLRVADRAVLENVKQLLVLKHVPKEPVAKRGCDNAV